MFWIYFPLVHLYGKWFLQAVVKRKDAIWTSVGVSNIHNIVFEEKLILKVSAG